MKASKPTLKTAINPTRAENYPEWYQQVVKAADLAEISPVRGCMIIKPWGYAIWENLQIIFNEKFKATGHKNVYFPLLIPLQFLQKEADHIEGFAKECAVVTHHRLSKNSEGKLIPDGKLEEPYIIRPTSETIIGDAFARWIQSYRDLPVLINQWANVMRWEMRTRLFLRTSEFLWQEGHTAHASQEEAQSEVLQMLKIYTEVAENYLAMPVIPGEKTESERFPGAVATYTLEAMMQDKKALQAGTSHFLGQNFAKGFNIKYLSKAGKEEFVWTTSWGVSTRLIGGLIMTHSDDDGLILPPKIAPLQLVILPIIHKEEDRKAIEAYCLKICQAAQTINYHGKVLAIEIDNKDISFGEKAWSWVKKGVPIRLEIGKKECENQTVFMGRRDKTYKDKKSISFENFLNELPLTLDEIQNTLLKRAETFQQTNSYYPKNKDDFYQFFQNEGGFAYAHWNENPTIEKQIKADLNVTIRCIPFNKSEAGKCIFTGEESNQMVVFAKAY